MCEEWSLECLAEKVGLGISETIFDAIQNAVLEAVGGATAALGTMWVHIPTPKVTSDSAPASVGDPAGLEGLNLALGWVMWIGLAIALASILVLGARFALARRYDRSRSLGRLGTVLVAVLLLSSASALVAALLPGGDALGCPDPDLKGPDGTPLGCASGTVGFIQSSLAGYMGIAVLLSIAVAAIRMAWEQRAQPGKDLVRSLLTLIVVSGAGLAIISLLTGATDQFSTWILGKSLECDIATDKNCFSGGMAKVLVGLEAGTPLAPLIVTLLGLFAILISFVQIGMMIVRSAMLVLLAGVLPLTASATNTEMGQAWFKRATGWLIAFLLYKPVAAIVYATSFQLVGEVWAKSNFEGIVSTTMGLALMVMSLVALPALMRFVAPLVGQTVGGGAGTGAMAASSALPTGASPTTHTSNSASHSTGGQTSSPTGSTATTGSTPGTGGGNQSASPGPASGTQVSGGTTAGSGAGATGGGSAAAGGPAALALIAAQKGTEVAQAAEGTVRDMAEEATGEGTR
jgi:hypothetical protein